MTRRRKDQSITQRDLTRAMKASRAAGIKARYEVDTMRRKITIIPDEPTKDGAVPEAEPTPLEQWRAKRSGQG
jgi:hypothetical protein